MCNLLRKQRLLLQHYYWWLLLLTQQMPTDVAAIQWDHSVYLNDDYRMLWTSRQSNNEITIEVQVRTHGYVGLGFSPNGERSGSDVAIGWIDKGQTYFQVYIHLRSLLLF